MHQSLAVSKMHVFEIHFQYIFCMLTRYKRKNLVMNFVTHTSATFEKTMHLFGAETYLSAETPDSEILRMNQGVIYWMINTLKQSILMIKQGKMPLMYSKQQRH